MKTKVLFTIVVMLFFSNIIFCGQETPPVDTPTLWGTFTVVRVIDGDTIIIQDENGNEVRIRLIGADTPELNEPMGQEAKIFTTKQIAESNNKVTLYYDGDTTDRYGRSLALVYITDKDDKKVMLNELLIRKGLAVARVNYNYSTHTKTTFKLAQNNAKEKKLKIWAPAIITKLQKYTTEEKENTENQIKKITEEQNKIYVPDYVKTKPTTSTYSIPTYSGSGTVQVKGYYRKDGTYVKPHTRSKPKK
jgi:micrococcal nuclease